MATLSTQALKERMATDPSLVVIDVRTDEEVREGMIPHARHMDASSPAFISQVKDLPKDKSYCIYCASGGRTAMIAPFFESQGFTQVTELAGGIVAWIAEGGDVV
jgi:rhodanese-related sulfurtransferase